MKEFFFLFHKIAKNIIDNTIVQSSNLFLAIIRHQNRYEVWDVSKEKGLFEIITIQPQWRWWLRKKNYRTDCEKKKTRKKIAKYITLLIGFNKKIESKKKQRLMSRCVNKFFQTKWLRTSNRKRSMGWWWWRWWWPDDSCLMDFNPERYTWSEETKTQSQWK